MKNIVHGINKSSILVLAQTNKLDDLIGISDYAMMPIQIKKCGLFNRRIKLCCNTDKIGLGSATIEYNNNIISAVNAFNARMDIKKLCHNVHDYYVLNDYIQEIVANVVLSETDHKNVNIEINYEEKHINRIAIITAEHPTLYDEYMDIIHPILYGSIEFAKLKSKDHYFHYEE